MSPPCTLSERPLRRTFIRTNAAAGHTGIRPYADGFNVVGCTATRNSFTEGLLPGVDARDNTSTTGTGVPIYWLKGARVANNYADFYDGSWDDEANVKNESGSNGLDTNQSANYPWTGCEDDGTDTEGLGNSDEAVIVGRRFGYAFHPNQQSGRVGRRYGSLLRKLQGVRLWSLRAYPERAQTSQA